MNRWLSLVVLLGAGPAAADLAVVIVEGLGGESRYESQFAEQIATLERVSSGVASDADVQVFRNGAFSREDVLTHLEDLADRQSSSDRLALFLVGHGSFDEHEYKFNIAGPDLTGADLVDALDGSPAGSQLLVNTSSSSGAMLERLKADNRTLILATRSGVERHATRFGAYFVAALDDSGADVDKNDIVTAEEAFLFAERQVSDFYERNGQLATEHPRMEGDQASRFSLARLGATRPAVTVDPELTRLLARRDALNADIEDLRVQRDSMTAEAYQSALLERMLELATLEDEIESRESGDANER